MIHCIRREKQFYRKVKKMTSEFLETKSLMLEFYDSKGIKIPCYFNRIVALVMLDTYYSIDNLRAIKRVYNRIRHCRHTMLISTTQALDLLEYSYTYTPDFNTLPLEYTIDDDDTYTIGTLDELTAKKYELEISANSIADKIKEEQLTARLFDTMPETRYNNLKIAVLKLLDFYDKELTGNKLDKEEKSKKKSLQEKIRTYLIRWYGIRPTVNYSFCVAYYESTQKYEMGLYND